MLELKQLAAEIVLSQYENKTIGTIHTDKGDFVVPYSTKLGRTIDKAASSLDPNIINKMVNNATYFIDTDSQTDSQIVDFRPTTYDGYVMPQPLLNEFVDSVGGDVDWKDRVISAKRPQDSIMTNLGDGVVDEMEVDGVLRWSPFETDVNIQYELTRLACMNVMDTSNSQAFNRFSPIVNMPLQNINLLFDMMKIQLKNFIQRRLKEMSHSPVSVADMMKLHQLLHARIGESENIAPIITQTLPMVNVETNSMLQSTWQPEVFADNNLATQAQGTLSEFVFLQLATQVKSHSKGSDSSDANLNLLASKMLFNGSDFAKTTKLANSKPVEMYDDTKRAFFGKTK